ncbi:winged helix-turn-helix transcriptional regulator [Ramlibacter sp. G-1-2-2]|uniref:Winged helix-turn-helix transcriptional regulator n=1 Tax=Ramlibacter agri TaxID=2728837 RepID=A0A848HC00_9BURK|nr:MarR family winged helix-turn-helix transcriptional regulator [Ramlibacter agri]NML47019.1 winged helix-turn-helix transcriptional regulator [Ramlibacter agri]
MIRKSVDLVNKGVNAPDEVLDAIHGVMHAWRSRQYQVLREAEQPVTHVEGKALGFFARHPGATQSELVAHTGRDKGQLARLIAGLRERGLLEARADEADRRSQHLHLTAEGEAAHQALRRQAKKLATVAVKGLDEGERQQLLALLERVRANLDQAD